VLELRSIFPPLIGNWLFTNLVQTITHQISAQQDAIGFFTKLVFMEKMAKQDDYVRYTIRVPKEPYAAIEKAAMEAGRSMNAEIVQRLSDSLEVEAGGDHRLMLDLPEGMMKELSFSSMVYDQSIEEYAISVLHRDVERLAEFQSAADQIFELEGKLTDRDKEISFLKSLSESDFSAFYTSVLLLWTLTQTVLRHGSKLPADVIDEIERRKASAERMIKNAERRVSDSRDHLRSEGVNDSAAGLRDTIESLLRHAAREMGIDDSKTSDKDSAA
jgi:hypothetical protein